MRFDTGQVSTLISGVSFPAHRWELVAWADFNGAGNLFREALLSLPEWQFESFEQVHSEINSTVTLARIGRFDQPTSRSHYSRRRIERAA